MDAARAATAGFALSRSETVIGENSQKLARRAFNVG
jgi:hypothetical protein